MPPAAASPKTPGLSREELLALPAAVDLVTAGRAFSIGRTLSYELHQRGEFPVPVLRLGNAFRVRSGDILAALGITPTATGTGA